MFTQSVMCKGTDEALQEAGAQAFTSLVMTIQEGIDAGTVIAGDTTTHALAMWALVHGVAMLLIDGALSKPPYRSDSARSGASHMPGFAPRWMEYPMNRRF